MNSSSTDRQQIPFISLMPFLFLGIPLLYFGSAALMGNIFAEPYPFPSFQALFAATVLTVIKGPIEEFDWRGLALPLRQRKFAPIRAGLILGIIWGIWYVPAFLLGGTPQSAWSFTPFFAGSVAVGVIVTALFKNLTAAFCSLQCSICSSTIHYGPTHNFTICRPSSSSPPFLSSGSTEM